MQTALTMLLRDLLEYDEGKINDARLEAADLIEANTDRIAALEAAIDQAALWFGEYANSHEKKGDTDKAKRNRDRCDFCRAALESIHDC